MSGILWLGSRAAVSGAPSGPGARWEGGSGAVNASPWFLFWTGPTHPRDERPPKSSLVGFSPLWVTLASAMIYCVRNKASYLQSILIFFWDNLNGNFPG